MFLTFLLGAIKAHALQRNTNLVISGEFEQQGSWGTVGGGYRVDRDTAHGGHQSLRCTSTNLLSTHGAKQVITLVQPLRHPSGALCQPI